MLILFQSWILAVTNGFTIEFSRIGHNGRIFFLQVVPVFNPRSCVGHIYFARDIAPIGTQALPTGQPAERIGHNLEYAK